MNVSIRSLRGIVDTMRLLGRKRFSRLASMIGVLVILGAVAMLLMDERHLFSRIPAWRTVSDLETQSTDSGDRSRTEETQVIYHENTTFTHFTHTTTHQEPRVFLNLQGQHTSPMTHDTDKNHYKIQEKDRENYDKTKNENTDKVITIKKKNESSLPSSPSSSSTVRDSNHQIPSSSVVKAAATASNQSKTETHSKQQKEKFIIYVCDKTRYCYGLGDRQRAVSSLYVFSLVTKRTFGIVWTQPCPLTKFFRPGEVNWDIPSWKLKGKSSIELEFLKPKYRLYLQTSFNKQYPQDVVYVRTNHNFINTLQKLPMYRPHLPSWALKRDSYVTGYVWKMLMKPTDLIRQPLNEMLVKIFQDQQLDNNIVNSLRTSKMCRVACDSLRKYDAEKDIHATMDIDYLNDTRLSRNKNIVNCLSEIRNNQSSMFPKNYYNASQIHHDLVSWRHLNMFCKSKHFKSNIVNNKINIETIRKAKDYDVVDLNVVCIHARIGRNPDMPFDKVRNSLESTKALWEFARPYMERGHHLYIASDYDKVRQDSKTHFGLRAHSSDTPIVHIASVQENQNETEGMTLALWEQLFLMTSCKTLVRSHSGFSIIAGSVREALVGNKQRYMFEGGKIV